ncbi:hypothetical protein DFH06DRAFT_1122945 [Mycena polygramma]|nr:hypothetical protein DFH06DRAFT_1122945 [Mycena polygramma]
MSLDALPVPMTLPAPQPIPPLDLLHLVWYWKRTKLNRLDSTGNGPRSNRDPGSNTFPSRRINRKKNLRVPAIIPTRAATRLEPSSRNNKHPILKPVGSPHVSELDLGETTATQRSPSYNFDEPSSSPPKTTTSHFSVHAGEESESDSDSGSESGPAPRQMQPPVSAHPRSSSLVPKIAVLPATPKRLKPDSGFESSGSCKKSIAGPSSPAKGPLCTAKTPYGLREDPKAPDRNPGPLALQPPRSSLSKPEVQHEPKKPAKVTAAATITTVHAIERVSEALVSEATLPPNGKDATYYCLPCILAHAACNCSRSGAAYARCGASHQRCNHAGADADLLDTLERTMAMEQLGTRAIIGPLNAVLCQHRTVEVFYDLLCAVVWDYDAEVQELAFFFYQMEVVPGENASSLPEPELVLADFQSASTTRARLCCHAFQPLSRISIPPTCRTTFVRFALLVRRFHERRKRRLSTPPPFPPSSYYERPPTHLGITKSLLAEKLFNTPPYLQVSSDTPVWCGLWYYMCLRQFVS